MGSRIKVTPWGGKYWLELALPGTPTPREYPFGSMLFTEDDKQWVGARGVPEDAWIRWTPYNDSYWSEFVPPGEPMPPGEQPYGRMVFTEFGGERWVEGVEVPEGSWVRVTPRGGTLWLEFVPAEVPVGPSPPDPGDVDIMARTIFGEARGEGDLGKTAVGWTIMNRVAFARERRGYWWGNNIREVCLKPWQFSCWNPNDPSRWVIENVTPADPVFSQCLDIARRVISRRDPDPVDGATHYYAYLLIAAPDWVRGATYVTTIGGHHFYRDVP